MPFLPRNAASSCLRRARRFLDLAEEELSDSKVRNDLRRTALVMAVAAIDSYMHALVVRRLSKVRKSADLPKALARLEIPFSDIAKLADSSINAQRKGRRGRPWVQVKATLQRRLLKETYQAYDQVANALACAGVKEAWTRIGKQLNEKPVDTKAWLNALVHRRNQIVHEGDLKRASRPRHLRFNGIDQTTAVQEVDRMQRLIDAIEVVVT